MTAQPLAVHRLGRVSYSEAATLQLRLEAARLEGTIPETVLALEHPPVITLGHRGNRECLLATPEMLAARSVSLERSSRGGNATYHGPGQVVVYTIVSLRALRLTVADFVHVLEEAMIRASAAEGVQAERLPGKPGVFVGKNKVGAVGLHVSRGVTTHGLALNVDPDLSHFDLIVPCGLKDHGVTSLCREAGPSVEGRDIEERLVSHVASALGLEALEGPLPSVAGGGDCQGARLP